MISVLMSVRNGERFLDQAMSSVLGQSHGDFECIVIDDCSTDRTPEILAGLNDPRLRVERNAENLGLTRSLNKGLDMARGRYIARMDADDISRADRFARQVAFLDANPGVAIAGSWVEIIGDLGTEVWKPAELDEDIRCNHLFHSDVYHPVAMYRAAFFQEHGVRYDESYRCSQDYDLWVRVSRLGGRLANIPEALLQFRMHEEKIGVTQITEQDRQADRVRATQLGWLGVTPTAQELELHRAIATWRFRPERGFLLQARAWLERLATANQARKAFPEPNFSRLLGQRWFQACNAACGAGRWTLTLYKDSFLSDAAPKDWKTLLKMTLKCGLKRVGV